MKDEKKEGRRSLVSQVISIYIAVAVTVLAVGVWESVGTNNAQNDQLAAQNEQLAANSKTLAQFNHRLAIEGCQRSNFVRGKINVIAGALSSLLHKSIEEGEKAGRPPLTSDQQTFIEQEFQLLAPLNKINCKKRQALPPSLQNHGDPGPHH